MAATAEALKNSFKNKDVDELADQVLYRPVALMFVKLLMKLPRRFLPTPNQITLCSLLTGLVAAMNMHNGTWAPRRSTCSAVV